LTANPARLAPRVVEREGSGFKLPAHPRSDSVERGALDPELGSGTRGRPRKGAAFAETARVFGG